MLWLSINDGCKTNEKTEVMNESQQLDENRWNRRGSNEDRSAGVHYNFEVLRIAALVSCL